MTSRNKLIVPLGRELIALILNSNTAHLWEIKQIEKFLHNQEFYWNGINWVSQQIILPPYDFVIIDAPWRFKNWSMKEQAEKGEKWGRGQGRPVYDCMDDKDIMGLPIRSLLNDASYVGLWVTSPKLDLAMQCLDAWELQFITVLFYWVKTIKRGQLPLIPVTGAGLHFGQGYHTHGNVELMLLARPKYGTSTKGKRIKGKGLKRVNAKQSELIIKPVTEHSRKPDDAHQKIEIIYGNSVETKNGSRPMKRAELFARRFYRGWECIGNEIDGLDIREAIHNLQSQEGLKSNANRRE